MKDMFHPTSALVFYSSRSGSREYFVEHYDMDSNGNPINAHPLTVRESQRLAKSLSLAREEKEPSLRTDGILSPSVLFLDAINSKVIWYTRAMQRSLLFSEN